LPNCI